MPLIGYILSQQKVASHSNSNIIKVTQIRSAIGRPLNQRETLRGLGLNKINRTRELKDTPSVRGMINTVSHLVMVDDTN